MRSRTSRRTAAVAILSILALASLTAEAFAKSSNYARSRAALHLSTQTLLSSDAYMPAAPAPQSWTYRGGGGNVSDNTAGWGNVGAR